MNDSDPDKSQAPREFALQFITVVLVLCVVGFLGYAVFVRNGPNPPNNPNIPAPTFTYMGIGFAALMLVLHFVVPPIIVAMQRKQIARGTWNPSSAKNPISAEELSRMSDADKLFLLYQRSQFSVVAAMLAAAAFVNGAAYALEGDLVSLVVALLLVAVMLLRFPTRSRVERFLSEQGELLRQERQSV